MAGKGLFTIEGDRELIAALRGLTDEVARRVTINAVRKAGAPVLDQAQANMPVDTGAARDGLSLRRLKNRKRNSARVGFEVVWARWRELQERTVPDNPDGAKYPEGWFYPAAIEYGVPGKNRPAVAPVRRAYESTRGRAVAVGLAELKKGVARAAKRAAKGRA